MLEKIKKVIPILLLPAIITACQGQGFDVSKVPVKELVENTPLEGDPKIEQIDEQTQQAIDAMGKVVTETETTTNVDESVLEKLNATDSVLKIKKILNESVSKLGDSLLSAKDRVGVVKLDIQAKIDALDPNMPGYEKAKEKLELLIEKLSLFEFKLQSIADKVSAKLETVSAKLDGLLGKIADRLTKWDFTGITTNLLEKQLIKYKDKIMEKIFQKLMGV